MAPNDLMAISEDEHSNHFHEHYANVAKGVYSNSQYLADFERKDVSLQNCKDVCSFWGQYCPQLCTGGENNHCRTIAPDCKAECTGFILHSESHCTLYQKSAQFINDSDSVGTYYERLSVWMHKDVPKVSSGYQRLYSDRGPMAVALGQGAVGMAAVGGILGLGLFVAAWAVVKTVRRSSRAQPTFERETLVETEDATII